MSSSVTDIDARSAARHHAAGRLREAAAVYRRVLQHDPQHAAALHALGVMAHQTGRSDAAEKLLLRAVVADPQLAAAHDDLGSLWLLMGKPHQAVAALAEAVRVDPGRAIAHAHLGAALARLGRLDEAVAAYQQAVTAALRHRRLRSAVGIDPDLSRHPSARADEPAAAVAPPEPVSPPVPVPADPPGPVGPLVAATADLPFELCATDDELTAGLALVRPTAGTLPPDAAVTVDVFASATVDPASGAGPVHLPPPAAVLGRVGPAVPDPTDMGLVRAEPRPGAEPPVRADPPVAVVNGPVLPAGIDDGGGAAARPVDVVPVVAEGGGGVLADGLTAAHAGVAGHDSAAADAADRGLPADGGWQGPRPGEPESWPRSADAQPAVDAVVMVSDGGGGGPAPLPPPFDFVPPVDHAPLFNHMPAADDDARPPVVVPELGDPRMDAPAAARHSVGVGYDDGNENGNGSGHAVRPSPVLAADNSVFAIAAPTRPGRPAGGTAAAEAKLADAELADAAAVPPADDGPATIDYIDADVDAADDVPAAVEPTDGDSVSSGGGGGGGGGQDATPIIGRRTGGSPPARGGPAVAPPAAADEDPLVATRKLAKELRRVRREPAAEARMAVDLHREGTTHLRQRRVDEAIAALGQLVRLHPTSAKAHRDLGAAYLRADRLDEAAASLTRALELRPRFADAYASLADVYHLQGRVEDAVACYRHALKLRPAAATHSNLLLTLNYSRKVDARGLLAEHLRWAQVHAAPLAAEARPHENDPSPDRPLRIGYVSADFRRHAVHHFLEPVLAARDPAAVHVTCYSDVIRPDDVTDRLGMLADDWRDARGLSDAALADQIRRDQIDILVDLAGHTGTNRLLAFARRPAPVQVSYLGYPNTTGLSQIDYRLTDGVSDPPGRTEQFHAEELVRLPGAFVCYRPPTDAPDPAPPPAAAAGGVVTFGCFNILSKVTPEALGLWAKVMTVVPNSRLVMKDRLGTLAYADRRRYVRDILAYHRVAADRLELLGKEPDPQKHLASYAKVDVMLDPFPYNGTTTTCEALWMGVPVVALAGKCHAGRVGASVLTAAGLPELVGATPEAYARAAVVLARDPARLAELRRTLRPRLAASPLTDAARFTAGLEQAYRRMWHRWCETRGAGGDAHAAGAVGDTLSLSDD